MNSSTWDDLIFRNKLEQEKELSLFRSKPFPHHMPNVLPVAREAISSKYLTRHMSQAHLESLQIVRDFATYSRYIPASTCNLLTLDRFLLSGRYVLDSIEKNEFETLLDFIDSNFVEEL